MPLPAGVRVSAVRAASALLAVVLVALPTHAQRAARGPVSAPAPPPEPVGAPALSAAMTQLAARARPSVVEILTDAYAGGEETGVPTGVQREERGGAGVVLDADGTIVTNQHVVSGARRILVRLGAAAPAAPDEPVVVRTLPARIVGVDPVTDLAVLKVDGVSLAPLPFADSDALMPGQVVLAVGSPVGLPSSVSWGVVSATGRRLKRDAPVGFVQTDARLMPGSSGGPLLDLAGRVVGINTLILTVGGGTDGFGFAVPANLVRAVVAQLRAHGTMRRADLGLAVQSVTPALARGLALPVTWGALVSDVVAGSSAASAGLQPTDIVVRAGGRVVANAGALQEETYERQPGDTMALVVQRGAARFPVTLRLEASDEQVSPADLGVNPEEHLVRELDLFGVDLTRALRARLPGVQAAAGVYVAALVAGGSGDGAFQAGDVITVVNGGAVRTAAELRAALAAAKGQGVVVAVVERDGVRRFVAREVE